jgi:hypothetical protein
MSIEGMAAMIAAAAIIGTTVGLMAAPTAEADPPCASVGTYQYMPNPWYDGPLMPTWDTPGYYGGWTTGPVVCDPFTYACHGYVPSSEPANRDPFDTSLDV